MSHEQNVNIIRFNQLNYTRKIRECTECPKINVTNNFLPITSTVTKIARKSSIKQLPNQLSKCFNGEPK